MHRLLFVLLVLSACGGLVPPNSLEADEAKAKACAPRCVCGPPGEYTWCCACSQGRGDLQLLFDAGPPQR